MRSASGEGLAVSNRSPATTTRSTDSRSATAAISARTAWCSAARDRPRTALPTCQSAVCSSFTATPPPRSRLREAGERVVGRLGRDGAVGTAGGCRRELAGLAGPGGPRRERELDDERDRQLGLGDDHRARLDDRGPLALGGRQEAVLAPGRLKIGKPATGSSAGSVGTAPSAPPAGAGGSSPASLARVAHAGNGNWTTSGIGSSGWETIIVPGLTIVARWRWAGGRKPYSPRVAS